MTSGQFSISLHILTLLVSADGEYLSSEYLARSINIHPVLVRKEVSNLKTAGFITSKEGKNGGSAPAKPAHQILLSDVYQAVRNSPILGRQKNAPNPDCRIGKQINTHLDTLYQEAENALIEKLGKKTLADFWIQFK